MKIVTNALEGVSFIEWYPIIGLIIFMILFIVLVIKVARLKNNEVDSMSRLPLDEQDAEAQEIKQAEQ